MRLFSPSFWSYPRHSGFSRPFLSLSLNCLCPRRAGLGNFRGSLRDAHEGTFSPSRLNFDDSSTDSRLVPASSCVEPACNAPVLFGIDIPPCIYWLYVVDLKNFGAFIEPLLLLYTCILQGKFVLRGFFQAFCIHPFI